LGARRRRAGRQEDFRRGGAIAAASKLAGACCPGVSEHQSLKEKHRENERLTTDSSRRLFWPEGKQGARVAMEKKLGSGEIPKHAVEGG